MRFLFYTHSLVSDWNHGNAHFLRGVMRELEAPGMRCEALEPEDGWSRTNLVADQGDDADASVPQDLPESEWQVYGESFDHGRAVAQADVVIVHEWTDPALVARIGRHAPQRRRFSRCCSTTRITARSATAADIARLLDLDDYDGVLAFGEALRQRYLAAGWGDGSSPGTRRRTPAVPPAATRSNARATSSGSATGATASAPGTARVPDRAGRARSGLRLDVHGVRYPDGALDAIEAAGSTTGGWIANADVPQRVRPPSRHRPRAAAPLCRGPARHSDDPRVRGAGLRHSARLRAVGRRRGPVQPGKDLPRRPGRRDGDDSAAPRPCWRSGAPRRILSSAGLATIRARHTCAHRVHELLDRRRACAASKPGRHEEAVQ